MTPPKSNPSKTEPLQLAFDILKPAPLLVQREMPGFPISGKVEVDANGATTYMITVDIMKLIGAASGARAARAGARGSISKSAASMAIGAAKGVAGTITGTQGPDLSSLADTVSRGLRYFLGIF